MERSRLSERNKTSPNTKTTAAKRPDCPIGLITTAEQRLKPGPDRPILQGNNGSRNPVHSKEDGEHEPDKRIRTGRDKISLVIRSMHSRIWVAKQPDKPNRACDSNAKKRDLPGWLWNNKHRRSAWTGVTTALPKGSVHQGRRQGGLGRPEGPNPVSPGHSPRNRKHPNQTALHPREPQQQAAVSHRKAGEAEHRAGRREGNPAKGKRRPLGPAQKRTKGKRRAKEQEPQARAPDCPAVTENRSDGG